MNATLQNIANIKPITDYLLNVNKYTEIYNKDLSSIDHWLYGPCDIENYKK